MNISGVASTRARRNDDASRTVSASSKNSLMSGVANSSYSRILTAAITSPSPRDRRMVSRRRLRLPAE